MRATTSRAAAWAALGPRTRPSYAVRGLPQPARITLDGVRAGVGQTEDPDVQRVILCGRDTARGDLAAIAAGAR